MKLPVIDPPLVSLRGLKVFRGKQLVIRELSAEIARGKVTAIIGLNGSGKSTLLRTLVGEFPYEGTMQFRCGHDHSRPTPEYVGYVPQRLTIDPRLPLTVRDLLGLAIKRGPIFFGLGRKLVDKFRDTLRQVGVADILDVPVDGLSGGQLQRVLLALALQPEPELLLLDEPTSGIDFQSQVAFYELIAKHQHTKQITVVLVSHDLAIVRQFADHVLCLRDGIVQCEGTPEEMLTPERIAETFGPVAHHA